MTESWVRMYGNEFVRMDHLFEALRHGTIGIDRFWAAVHYHEVVVEELVGVVNALVFEARKKGKYQGYEEHLVLTRTRKNLESQLRFLRQKAKDLDVDLNQPLPEGMTAYMCRFLKKMSYGTDFVTLLTVFWCLMRQLRDYFSVAGSSFEFIMASFADADDLQMILDNCLEGKSPDVFVKCYKMFRRAILLCNLHWDVVRNLDWEVVREEEI